MDRPEMLKRLLFTPDQQRNYKFAPRYASDDDALATEERFIEIVSFFIEIKDDTQNWEERRRWLLSLFAEL